MKWWRQLYWINSIFEIDWPLSYELLGNRFAIWFPLLFSTTGPTRPPPSPSLCACWHSQVAGGFGLGIYCSIHSPTCPTLLYCCILLPTCLNLFIAANYFICWSLVWAPMSVPCRQAWIFKWHDLQLNHTLSAISWWAGLMSTYLINIHNTFKH